MMMIHYTKVVHQKKDIKKGVEFTKRLLAQSEVVFDYIKNPEKSNFERVLNEKRERVNFLLQCLKIVDMNDPLSKYYNYQIHIYSNKAIIRIMRQI